MLAGAHQYIVLVTDRNLSVVGDPIFQWQSLEAVPRFNMVGSGTLRTAATAAVRSVLEPGNRIMLLRDGGVFSAGPIETMRTEWAVDGAAAEPGQVTVDWADDLALIAGRVTYPNPALAATAQDTARRSFSSTNAETVLRTLVDENAGPSALTARQVPQLALGDVAGVGDDITWSTRFQPLGDELREVATIGGRLGFRTRQSGNQILFEVYAPQDLSLLVRFAADWGSLRSYDFRQSGPQATTVIVGGQGEGADRTIRERTETLSEADWWRIEQFADRRDTDDTDELDGAGDDKLAEAGEVAQLSTVTVDTDQQQFGRDYQLGDIVSVALRQGVQVTDVVRAVHLNVTPDKGELVTAMVGSQSASTDPEWIRQSRLLSRKLARSATAGEIATP